MPLDMSRYLGLFTSESLEHLESLSKDILGLEQERGPERIDSMFRHAHSLKGMAASMGFEPIAQLAHRVEDLVDFLRANPGGLSPKTTDVLLAATDHMLSMVKAAGAGAALPEGGELLARLAERLAGLKGSTVEPAKVGGSAAPLPLPPEGPVASQGTSIGALPPRFQVRVKVAATCAVPGVRAFLVHKKLAALGNLFDLQPPLDDLKAGRIPGHVFSVVLEGRPGNGAEAVRKVLSVVADLEAVDVASLEAAAPPKPPQPAAPVADVPRTVGAEPARTVRVKTELLDYFLDAAGELLLATAHLRELGKSVPESSRGPLEEGVDRLHAIVKDLHNKVMSVRMTPLSLITDRLPRAARDIGRKTGKEVDLLIRGAEIELDRAILDELADPLLHILRNCLDHGIEDAASRRDAGKSPRGRVTVTALRDRDRVVLEIEDDGKGMDTARLRAKAVERGLITAEAAKAMSEREAAMLCCLPGVSTASEVTDLSGRGVGMDAVKRTVENVGGTLEIDSVQGRGTRLTLRLPLTVAVVNVLLVGVGEEVYGVPIAKVKAVVEVDPRSLTRSRNAPLLSHGGALLPVHVLGVLLGVPAHEERGARPHVVLETEGGGVALEVDRLLGQEEAVLKPLSRPLDLVAGLAGVTLLGTGRPIFILDVPRLIAA